MAKEIVGEGSIVTTIDQVINSLTIAKFRDPVGVAKWYVEGGELTAWNRAWRSASEGDPVMTAAFLKISIGTPSTPLVEHIVGHPTDFKASCLSLAFEQEARRREQEGRPDGEVRASLEMADAILGMD